jgi:hypothetical protein
MDESRSATAFSLHNQLMDVQSTRIKTWGHKTNSTRLDLGSLQRPFQDKSIKLYYASTIDRTATDGNKRAR